MQRGSLSIATNPERLEELMRGASMARTFGLEVNAVSPTEIKRHWPLLHVGDVVGGVHLPRDGQTNPIDTTMALIKGATMRGVKVVENVAVDSIITKNGRAIGVSTRSGELFAENVVIAAGMWSRALGLAASVDIPLQACEHFYTVTEPFPGLTSDLPVLRDPDNCAYFKEDAGKLLLGAFEPNAKPWALDGIRKSLNSANRPTTSRISNQFSKRRFGDYPHSEISASGNSSTGQRASHPMCAICLEKPRTFRSLCRRRVQFDWHPVRRRAGKALAEWIVAGHAPMDLADVDIRRLEKFQVNKKYLRERVSESLGLLYAMHWPYRQYETARNVRISPLHERLAGRGACFGEAAGWERANWSAPTGVKPEYAYSYGRQNWFA